LRRTTLALLSRWQYKDTILDIQTKLSSFKIKMSGPSVVQSNIEQLFEVMGLNGIGEVERWINRVGTDGNTALTEAVRKGHVDCVEVLLKHGADVNVVSNYGTTALMRAAEQGHVDCVEVLLKHGANVNAADNYGWTALIWAATNGHSDCVEVLLKHGANVNAADNYGWTALIVAATNGHSDCVEALLKHGANVNAADNYGWTALIVAAMYGHSDCLEVLLNHVAEVNGSSGSCRNPSTGPMECSICLSPMGGNAGKSMAALPCGHIYCYDCLVRVDRLARGGDGSGNCPTCRQSYSKIEIKKVYIP
jgi:hypothetical protein